LLSAWLKPSLRVGTVLVVLGFAPLAIWLFWRQGLNPCITVSDDGVVVQNPYRRREVSYEDIARVEVDAASRLPLEIRLSSGSSSLCGRRAQRRLRNTPGITQLS
jgi:hypothetical protein